MNMNTVMSGEIKAVCARAAEQSEATETARQLSPELARALAGAGFFNMFVPASLGGAQLPPLEAMTRLSYLAYHDAASAWVSMIGATTALGAAYIDGTIGRDMFGARERITCGIFAPNGRAMRDGDDYIVSGRWAWASGSANADYIGLGCMTLDHADDEPSGKKIRLLMVPRDKIIFHDTWHTMGLCGTSSGDVELDNVRVPVAHSYSLATDTPWANGALYQMPYFALLAAGVAAVALGNARAALDDVIELASAKKAQGHGRILAERSGVQAALAQCEAEWRAAQALYETTLDACWQAAQDNNIEPEMKADLRLASTHAVRSCAEVVRRVHDIAGGTSVYTQSTIQRRLRDAQTMTQHMITNATTYEMTGRVLLGGDHPGMQL